MRCPPRLRVLLLSCAMSSGCLGLGKDYPEKKLFLLETVRTADAAAASRRPVLRVRPFRISPSYSGTEFLYRTGESSVETDYYNEFLIPPARLITENAMAWLEASRAFQSVLDYSSPMLARYVLDGNVRSIYGDYREEGRAQAVIEFQAFVTQEAAWEEGMLLQRDYSRRISVPDDSPEALVAGWNQCLSAIFTDMERDLIGTMTSRQ